MVTSFERHSRRIHMADMAWSNLWTPNFGSCSILVKIIETSNFPWSGQSFRFRSSYCWVMAVMAIRMVSGSQIPTPSHGTPWRPKICRLGCSLLVPQGWIPQAKNGASPPFWTAVIDVIKGWWAHLRMTSISFNIHIDIYIIYIYIIDNVYNDVEIQIHYISRGRP